MRRSDDVLDSLADPLYCGRTVHGVKVNAVAACGEKVDDLADGVGETCVKECIRIIAVAVYDALEIVRQGGTAGGYHSLDGCHGKAGHDAGCDRYIDTCDPRALYHLEEILVVEEKL